MKNSFIVIDGFCPNPEEVRASALQSGFGTWRPNKGDIGSSIYEGMSFWGQHSAMLRPLAQITGKPPLVNNMFFRSTNVDTEPAYVHSDRHWGTHTCIVYLTDHLEEKEISGTAFYRHRKTGLTEMPTMEELKGNPDYSDLRGDMVTGGNYIWQQTDFVRGVLNRALIFHAPLFHSRMPAQGFGTTPDTGRMVWVCHFVLD